jgi:hypothetical protein
LTETKFPNLRVGQIVRIVDHPDDAFNGLLARITRVQRGRSFPVTGEFRNENWDEGHLLAFNEIEEVSKLEEVEFYLDKGESK